MGARHGLLSNTMRMVQQWSGKLGVIAGHVEQAPAPYMERYHVAPPVIAEKPVEKPRSRSWRRSRTVRIVMQMRSRRARWGRTHPNSNRLISNLVIGLVALLIIVGSGGTAYSYTYYQSQLPMLANLANQKISQTTRIYDRTGATLFEVYASTGRRTPVSYDDIPKVMRDAQVAIEDDTFWTNSGVSPMGIARSFASSLKGDVQGGSTISQQVIKNMTGNSQFNITRKFTEAALAIGLTQQYPKWKILEMYFNVAPFGPLDLGIEAAVEEYFQLQSQCTSDFKCTPGVKFLNKDLAKCQEQDKTKCPDDPLLGLARSSLLAGLPQNPNSFYPAGVDGQKEKALTRQKTVLNRMAELKVSVDGLGVITPAIVAQAEALTAKMEFHRYERSQRAPHFVDWIINQVETVLGNGDPTMGIEPFITGGFNIRTTISAELEDYVEAVTKHHLTAEPSATADGLALSGDTHNVHDAAVVVMNSHTGEILAMNGSADYNDADIKVGGQFNAADPPTDANGEKPGLNTGSSFKPFVYATAFEMGWYPGMVIPDYHTNFPLPNQGAGALASQTEDQVNQDGYMYAPPDYDFKGRWNYALHDGDTYHDAGTVTVRTSLQESLNVGAVKAMKYAGPENVANMAHRLGLTSIKTDGMGIAWALGTQNSTVLQMTDAYQTFSNGGTRIPPQGILDIWDNYGNSLYHYDTTKPAGISVMSPQVAFLLTSVLRDEPSRAHEFGSYHTLSFTDIDPTCATVQECNYQVAAKTGTTDNFKDTWTMGYTPNIVVGTWTGNANGEFMKDILGISGAGTIWHSVIKTASGYCTMQDYTDPVHGFDDRVPCPSDNLAQTLGISQDKTFTAPAGVSKVSTSSTDGLQGSGNLDYMIDGLAPQQSSGVQNNR
jgi:membrane peptidoglycan carboxypeptidase